MSELRLMDTLDLITLADEINAEHRACDEALRAGLNHAVRAGELLIKAKAQVKHGEWGTWIRDNFEGSARSAQAYMKVAREVPNLEGAKAQRVALLSFRNVLKEISPSKPDGAPYATLVRPTGREGEVEVVREFRTMEEYAAYHDYRISPPLLIDEEFRSLLPPHRPEEYTGLEKSIVEEGCRDVIVAWNNTILDGHARYEICVKHGIDYLVLDKEIENRSAAMAHILEVQLGRKNLGPYQAAYIRGKEEVRKMRLEHDISEDQAWEDYLNAH